MDLYTSYDKGKIRKISKAVLACHNLLMCWGRDSNPRSLAAPDLQSGAIVHSATPAKNFKQNNQKSKSVLDF